MHLDKTLLFFLTVASTGVASPAPLPGPFGGSCDPYDEDDVDKNTWSIQFYKKPNCEGDRIKRVESQTGNWKENTCYQVPAKTRSFHGVGHTKYAVSWYSDKNCEDDVMVAQYGHWEEKDDMKEGELRSFYISMPKDRGPEKRIAICGQVDSDDGWLTSESDAWDICRSAQQKCVRNGGNCPDLETAKIKNFEHNACEFKAGDMQDYFDEYCEDKRGDSCLRPVGNTDTYVPCRSDDSDEAPRTTPTGTPTALPTPPPDEDVRPSEPTENSDDAHRENLKV